MPSRRNVHASWDLKSRWHRRREPAVARRSRRCHAHLLWQGRCERSPSIRARACEPNAHRCLGNLLFYEAPALYGPSSRAQAFFPTPESERSATLIAFWGWSRLPIERGPPRDLSRRDKTLSAPAFRAFVDVMHEARLFILNTRKPHLPPALDANGSLARGVGVMALFVM